MTSNSEDLKARFMSWLSGKPLPSSLEELQVCYADIENECQKAGVINHSLFDHLYDYKIGQIRKTIEKRHFFRLLHRKKFKLMMSAIDYLILFAEEQDRMIAALMENDEEAVAEGQNSPAPETAPDEVTAEQTEELEIEPVPPVSDVSNTITEQPAMIYGKWLGDTGIPLQLDRQSGEKPAPAVSDKTAESGTEGIQDTQYDETQESAEKNEPQQMSEPIEDADVFAGLEGFDADSIREPPASGYEEPGSVRYCDRYGLDPAYYSSEPVLGCGFPVRVTNRLINLGIHTIGKLLEQSDDDLKKISGIGATSIAVVNDYLSGLARSGQGAIQAAPVHQKTTLPRELAAYTEDIKRGDFSFSERQTFSFGASSILQQYREAYDVLGQEFVKAIHDEEPEILAIYEMLAEFVDESRAITACKEIIAALPKERLQMDALALYRGYALSEKDLKDNPRGLTEGMTLEQYIYANAGAIGRENAKVMRFLRWCRFQVAEEINDYFESSLLKDRGIYSGRAHGETLEALGAGIGVTRERVTKGSIIRVIRRYCNFTFLDLGKPVLSSAEIIDHVGKYGAEFAFLLKAYCEYETRQDPVFYNARFDLFTIDQSLDDMGIQEYVDSLPELFAADAMDGYIIEGAERYSFPREQVQRLIEDVYKRTGDTYHRSRFSLGTIYSVILRKYYPDGIHLDDTEMDRFRQLVLDVFGVDISDKSFHAIGSTIMNVGILCGRGTYKFRGDGEIIPGSLAQRIYQYVMESEFPVFLFRTLFKVFEDDLRAAGVNNHYYLQGILKELYKDEWFITRDSLSKDPSVTSIYASIIDFIKKSKEPVSKSDIEHQFQGVTNLVIAFATDEREVLNYLGIYLHASHLRLSKADIKYLRITVERALQKQERCNCRELFKTINSERPQMLSMNYIMSQFGLFSLLEYLFEDEYVFKRPYIARRGSNESDLEEAFIEDEEDDDLLIGSLLADDLDDIDELIGDYIDDEVEV